jgi:hypothetical protein
MDRQVRAIRAVRFTAALLLLLALVLALTGALPAVRLGLVGGALVLTGIAAYARHSKHDGRQAKRSPPTSDGNQRAIRLTFAFSGLWLAVGLVPTLAGIGSPGQRLGFFIAALVVAAMGLAMRRVDRREREDSGH